MEDPWRALLMSEHTCPFYQVWLRHLGNLSSDQKKDLSAWCHRNKATPDQLREVLTELGKDGRRVPLIKAYNLWGRWYRQKREEGVCGACDGLGFRYVVMVESGDKTRAVPHRRGYIPLPNPKAMYYENAIPCKHCRPGRSHNDRVGLSEAAWEKLDHEHAITGQEAGKWVAEFTAKHRVYHGLSTPVGDGPVSQATEEPI
jgi:hypothetical protein